MQSTVYQISHQSNDEYSIVVIPQASLSRPRVEGCPLPVRASRPLARPAAEAHALGPGRPLARPGAEARHLAATSLGSRGSLGPKNGI